MKSQRSQYQQKQKLIAINTEKIITKWETSGCWIGRIKIHKSKYIVEGRIIQNETWDSNFKQSRSNWLAI